MKQAKVNLPSGTYLIQEVPEDARGFCEADDGTFVYLHGYGLTNMCAKINAKYNSWQLLGADPLKPTEEEAGEIVESWPSVWGDGVLIYQNYPDEIPKCRTATASLDSLAGSLGISKPFVVLKNK